MDLTSVPHLTHLHTLCTPNTHGTRAWQSTPHPSPRTPLLATASSDRTVNIWSLRDFRLLSTIAGGHKRSVRTVDWRDYGRAKKRKVAGDVVGGDDEEEEQEDKNDTFGEGNAIEGTGEKRVTLATGSFDANVGIWEHNADYGKTKDDMETDVGDEHQGQEEEEEWNFSTLLTGPDSEIKSVAFGPAHYGAALLATSSRDKSVWVWEEVEGEEWETVAVCQEHQGDVKVVGWCEGARVRGKDDDDDEEEDEEKIVGCREVLASGSYDDTVRLWRDVEEEGDWVCVAVIEGHAGTVWDLKWERCVNWGVWRDAGGGVVEAEWEPRIVSCSDDMSVRMWRRELSEAEREKKKNNNNNVGGGGGQARLPSIIRPTGHYETWVQDASLPQVHVRSVYAVDWSRESGLVVSCGGDGTVVVYQEQLLPLDDAESEDVVMNGTQDESGRGQQRPRTKWVVVAAVEAAHDEYEVNHVCWATRRDRGRRFEGEEMIVSTGDDGAVKLWVLPAGLVQN